MIFRAFRYIGIKHEQKFFWDFVYPACIAAIAGAILWFFRIDITFTGSDGVLRQTNSLLAVLAGFYIASLTAISALPIQTLDEKMAGTAPTMTVVQKGKKYSDVPLKRREFLRYLFGYLSTATIILFFVGIVTDLLYAPVIERFQLEGDILESAKIGFAVAYIFSLANVIINTLIAVYYLSDRIHKPVNETEIVDLSDDGVSASQEQS